MMHQPSHIASAMEIVMDAQLPSKGGSGGLEYYYDMLLIALLAAHDEGAADFHQQHRRAPWWKVNSPFFLEGALEDYTESSIRRRPNI